MDSTKHIDSKLSRLIKTHYYYGNLNISLAELYVQCRRAKDAHILGDWLLFSHIIKRIGKMIPKHKWKYEHVLHVVENYTDIPRETAGYKKLIRDNFRYYMTKK